jgi:hypothetical protein
LGRGQIAFGDLLCILHHSENKNKKSAKAGNLGGTGKKIRIKKMDGSVLTSECLSFRNIKVAQLSLHLHSSVAISIQISYMKAIEQDTNGFWPKIT